MYQPKGAIGIIIAHQKLFHAQCEEGTEIEAHIRIMTSYQHELVALGSKLSKDKFLITILTSLPDSWNNFISGIDTTALTESTKIIAHILEQDHRKNSKPNSDVIALAAKHFCDKGRSPKITCYGCGRPGHIIANCRNTKSGKIYTAEQKQQNLENAQEHYAENSQTQAHVANDSESTFYAFKF